MVKGPIDPTGVLRRAVERVGSRPGGADDALDAVIAEEPLEIRVDGETIGVTMRTPGDDARLALGFLFGEGIVRSLRDVGTVTHCGRPGEPGFGNVIDVRSGPGTSLDADRILEGRRFVPTTSACGVCGRQTIDDLVARCGTLEGGATLSADAVLRCVERMRSAQARFEKTGGVHAAAAFDAAGELICCFEDVGRHNAVDKVVGELLRFALVGEGARGPAPALLVVSGRAGFEIVQKAAAAKIAIVASVSATTSLAIDLAASAGVTLAGFARGASLNVYTHPWRIAAQGRLRAVPRIDAAPQAGEPEDPAGWFPHDPVPAPDPAPPGMPAHPDGPRGPKAQLHGGRRLAADLVSRTQRMLERRPARRIAAGGAVDFGPEEDGFDVAWAEAAEPVPLPAPAPAMPVRTAQRLVLDRGADDAAVPPAEPAPPAPEARAAVLIDDRDPDHPAPIFWPGGWSTGRVR